MKESNVSSITLGIESGDPFILKKMNKNINLENPKKIVKLCNRLKIPVKIFFMFCYPGETEESFYKTVKYAQDLKKLGATKLLFNLTRAYPGTHLFAECIKRGYLQNKDVSEYIYLGNVLTEVNAIITPEFSFEDIKKRQYFIQKKMVPLWHRVYSKYSEQIKYIIPDVFIQNIKKIINFEK